MIILRITVFCQWHIDVFIFYDIINSRCHRTDISSSL